MDQYVISKKSTKPCKPTKSQKRKRDEEEEPDVEFQGAGDDDDLEELNPCVSRLNNTNMLDKLQ